MSECKAPAEAYFEVAAFLGEDYFLTPPPPSGRRVEIIGRDSVTTHWDLSHDDARRLVAFAHGNRHLAFIGSVPYVEGTRSR